MGNTHTKEVRGGSRAGAQGSRVDLGGSSSGAGYHGELPDRLRRGSRPELGINLPFGGSSNSRQPDAPFEHRETKQEKEARRLERERVARAKERERSMKEEHVDGGYLVTMGVYTASEDFNKPVVRQLQIERRIAPFWRGLDDFSESWAEHQIIAAARGLEIPPADAVPEHLMPQPRPTESPGASIPNLTVPLGPRTLSASSENPNTGLLGSTLSSPTSPSFPRTSSPFKPHKKSLAAALNLSRNGSHTDIISPREINLPHDPFVNGQPLEVFLYKEGIECPLCLMYYPPYLNRTRCCCQIICSECFVQIKRPDPHFPEHHGDDESSQAPAIPDEHEGELVMEPAKCPYCTQSEFGVTYEAPPFRRGLTYAFNISAMGAISTAMSSSSSLNSSLSPTSATPLSNANRRRTQSVSADAPGVITTDRIRPDWSTRLAAARAQQRRRAAAADALHHAAFVMGNQESRNIFGRPSRFSRRGPGSHRGNESPSSTSNVQGNDGGADAPSAPEPGPRTSSGRIGPGRERIDAAHLENLMMAEAIRLSLADEEERRKKAEKEARKEAKKKEKEERKTAKKKGDVYGGGSGSGASASSLSLRLGRRRGNSGASNLRMEVGEAAVSSTSTGQDNIESAGPASSSGLGSPSTSHDKGKAIDRSETEEGQLGGPSASSLPMPVPRGASHLRQMSNASSVSSSGVDSMPGSYTGKGPGADAEDPRSSGLATRSEDGDHSNSEPMFNFRSLAEMVGVPIDGDAQSPDDQDQPADAEKGHGEHIEHATSLVSLNERENKNPPRLETHESSQVSEERAEDSISPPQLMVTPETPAPVNDGTEESKQLGHIGMAERTHEVTQ
ncbi:hypothetical protein F4820DRAFT_281751 [Hypoxylon rubiginosum]|uniref:Uncharacterized protein n=1 Tax=Hypoxylon rubiginosum TaxID=110542 RepID=A0ACB9Z2H3_9PEZI|nr:hypothetical protein F4820DRAFT_281751 [Hypoxylon rubiginosum]